MTKGKADYGKYNLNDISSAHARKLSVKVKLRKTYIDTHNEEPFILYEPFAGRKLMFRVLYNKYHISRHFKADINPWTKDIQNFDALTYPRGKKINCDVLDLDDYRLQCLKVFAEWMKVLQTDCTIFLTFGVESFNRKTRVKASTVMYKESDKIIQLSANKIGVYPKQFIHDVCKDNGFEIENEVYLHVMSNVMYVGLRVKKL